MSELKGSLVPLFSLQVLDTTLPCAAQELVRRARADQATRVVFANAHVINACFTSAAAKNACESADLVFADGVGVAVAARFQGREIKNNVNGTDLLPVLCGAAAAAKLPIALWGAKPGVADEAAKRIQIDFPDIDIAWVHHGYYVPEDEEKLIGELKASGAKILLVALGVPAQEIWLADNRDRIASIPVVMGVGGLLDFMAASVPRAPLFVRKLRLEWFFRFLIEPRRLFYRYFIEGPLFLVRTLTYKKQ